MFRVTDGKGIHMKFENGWTLSVQWGPQNYCDNRTLEENSHLYMPFYGDKGSHTAEIAAWDKNNQDFVFPDGDTVQGYLTADEVVSWMVEISNL